MFTALQIEYVININDLRADPNLRKGLPQKYTVYLLADGQCLFDRKGILGGGWDTPDISNLRARILEALGCAYDGFLEVGNVQFHYLGMRILHPLLPSKRLPEGVPERIAVQDSSEMFPWFFQLRAHVLNMRRDIQPDPEINVFNFTVPRDPPRNQQPSY